MPPVGMNRSWGNGPAIAARALAPPIASAGKNFTSVMPSASAIWISVGVATPGMTGIPRSWPARTTSRL